MSSSLERAHWRPTELVVQALHQSLDSFVAALPSAYLLLIELDGPDSELAMGLRDQEVAVALDTQVRTAVSRAPDALPTATRARESLSSMASLAGPHTGRAVHEDRIPSELRTRYCHFVLLQKRDSSSFLHHVSVGRARNHDIVLRHDTVSKFHAWFELSPDAGMMVKDMDSTNHTFVEGARIDKRTMVAPGQTVRFGSVICHVTTPATFWRSLRR